VFKYIIYHLHWTVDAILKLACIAAQHKYFYSSIWIMHSDSCASAHGVSGLQTAKVIQRRSLLLLCDYRRKSDEMHERAVPIDAQLAPEQHK
jgi:hypothetical protein